MCMSLIWVENLGPIRPVNKQSCSRTFRLVFDKLSSVSVHLLNKQSLNENLGSFAK